jgi:hypothetical protein
MTHTLRCPRLGSEVFLSSLRSGFFIPLGFDIARPPAISRKLSIGLLTPVSTLGGLIVPLLRSVHDVQRLGFPSFHCFAGYRLLARQWLGEALDVRGSASQAAGVFSKIFLVYSINGMR